MFCLSQDFKDLDIYLSIAESTTQRTYKYGGTSELVKGSVSNAALDMIRRSFLKTRTGD